MFTALCWLMVIAGCAFIIGGFFVDVVPILSRQSTMTRWYLCRDCGHQFKETTAVSMPAERVTCESPECGKTGLCIVSPRK